MALRDEIIPYVDGEGLVAPNLISPGTLIGSDNGPMYTSEYYIMLEKLGQPVSQDKADFLVKIGGCMSDGLLNRYRSMPSGQEGPDDYYGVLNACMQMEDVSIPRNMLKSVVKYVGFLNNQNPGRKTWQSFLIRQPQLLGCMIASAFPRWNPLHFACRILAWPFFFAAAVSVGISCLGTPTNDTDARRLSWHVMQNTKGVSLVCWLASKMWLRRLYRDYPDGMQGVAKIYYRDNHPFQRYWVTE